MTDKTSSTIVRTWLLQNDSLVSLGYELLQSVTVTFRVNSFLESSGKNGTMTCSLWKIESMQTSKLGLFLDTIRSTGAPSFIIEVEMGWSLLWGQTDVWVIFWIGMRTTPGILYCTPILLFRTKLKYFSGQSNSKYNLEVGSVITDDRNRNSTSGTFFNKLA